MRSCTGYSDTMKKLPLIVGTLLSLDSFSQAIDSSYTINGYSCNCTIRLREEPVIFDKIQKGASFPAGEKAWKNFAKDSLGPAFRNKEDASEFQMQFVVKWDGSVSDIRTTSIVSEEKVAEAKRLILLSGKWCPGVQNGRCETSYRRLPFKF